MTRVKKNGKTASRTKPCGDNQIAESRFKLREPAFDLRGVFHRADDGDPEAAAIQAVAGAFLHFLGGDSLDAVLDFRGVEDVAVAEEAFAHPHHLIRGAFEAHQGLADGVVLGLS